MKLTLISAMALSVALGGGVAASCSQGCTSEPSCMEPSVVVSFRPRERTDVASATICVDGKCETVGWQDGLAIVQLPWRAGESVDVSVTIVDGTGEQLGSIQERRKMTSSRCDCGGFSYRLDDSDLHRTN